MPRVQLHIHLHRYGLGIVLYSMKKEEAPYELENANGVNPFRPLQNKTLQLRPLPNPYPIALTPFSLDFGPPLQALFQYDVTNCIVHARSNIMNHIHVYGDGLFPPFPYTFEERSGSVTFLAGVISQQSVRDVMYSDIIAILEVFLDKMIREGYFRRYATIITTTLERNFIGNTVVGFSGDQALQRYTSSDELFVSRLVKQYSRTHVLGHF